MTIAKRHIIRKQIIELELPSQQNAWQFQQKAGRLFQEKVIGKLEPILDRLNLSGEHLRIPHLEIDLGTIPPSQFEQVFVRKCILVIRQVLEKEAAQFNVKPEKEATRKLQEAITVFLCFIESSLLPWYTDFYSVEALEIMVWGKMKSHKNEFKIAFITSAQKSPIVLDRLIQQFSLPFIKSILNIILGVDSTLFPVIETHLRKFLKQHLSTTEERKLCLALLKKKIFPKEIKTDTFTSLITQIKQISLHPKNRSEEKILQNLIRQQFFIQSDLSIQKLTKHFFQEIKSDDSTKSITKAKHTDSNSPEESTVEKLKRTQPVDNPKRNDSNIHKSITQDQNDIIEPKLDHSEKVISFPKEGYYIGNAGLIICAHFLKIIFAGFELIENNVFKNAAAQNRALALTQYMVTGEENVAEFLLPLNKVLCGVPHSAPINRMIDLTQKEKEEAENLLNHLIKHWTILGNSSIESLRNTFLKRKGKLTFEENRSTWLLQIEKTGFDICVERLPWSISIIKLPWMKEPLHVDWV